MEDDCDEACMGDGDCDGDEGSMTSGCGVGGRG